MPPRRHQRNVFPSGKYYVGDMCYAFDYDMAEKIYNESERLSGDLHQGPFYGMRYYEFSTGGDGVFEDQKGRVYPVDAGNIACIHEKWVSKEYIAGRGHIIEFKKPFKCWCDKKGVLHFGKEVSIEVGIL